MWNIHCDIKFIAPTTHHAPAKENGCALSEEMGEQSFTPRAQPEPLRIREKAFGLKARLSPIYLLHKASAQYFFNFRSEMIEVLTNKFFNRQRRSASLLVSLPPLLCIVCRPGDLFGCQPCQELEEAITKKKKKIQEKKEKKETTQ